MVLKSLKGSRPGEELRAIVSQRCGPFCWCPPGPFKMGPHLGPPAPGNPVEVTFSEGFWLGKYPVTQAQYELVTGTNPSGFTGRTRPVESIDKRQAELFCKHLTELEHSEGSLPSDWEFRLPTEAEWEYACRAGTDTAFSWGDDEKLADDFAWYRGNAGNMTQPVGRKKPNPWGFHDLHGNCLELCQDVWQNEPPGGLDPLVSESTQPGGGRFITARGGGWLFDAPRSQSRVRNRIGASDQSYLIGFRIALVRSTGAQMKNEIESAVLNFHRYFAEGQYDEAIKIMGPSMSVFPPAGGTVQVVPDDRSVLPPFYSDLHGKGLRQILVPRDIRVKGYGNVAFATFLTDGVWWQPPGSPKITRRVTQVWEKFDGQWKLMHGHVSPFDPPTSVPFTPAGRQALDNVPEDSQPVVMINLLRYRDQAIYPEGFDAAPASGREAFQRFGMAMAPLVAAAGGKTFWMGQVQAGLIAPHTEKWDDAILIEYPSRAAFLSVVNADEYKVASTHRTAGLEDSRLLAARATPLP